MMTEKRNLLVLVVTALLLLAQVAAPAQAQGPSGELLVNITQVDTSQFPTVTVYVSVTDAAGEPVGIEPEQLVLMEDNVVIQPDQMIGSAGVVESLTTLLVIDISGSMESASKLDNAKAAAHAYVDLMRAGDRVGVLAFNTAVTYIQPITTDMERVDAAIDALSASEDTAMYDALVEAAAILAPLEGRKAIIALTDGMDNMSQYGLEDVITSIGPSGLTISTIGLGNPEETETYAGLDVMALMSLAGQAGGEYAYANDPTGLTRLYERYARALQSEYAITYTSPATLRDGLTRNLTVSLADAGGEAQAAAYNPGGLVPEVGEPAGWGFFLLVLGLLVLLLILPGIVGLASRMGKRSQEPKKPKTRIRLRDE